LTSYGWDASHYDAVPDGGRVVAEGFTFMTHKAGGDKDDAELGSWWRALRPWRGKILLGAYWVLRNTDGSNAADAFLARLDSQCPGWRDGPFILQLDCEPWNDGQTPAPTKAQIKECADRLRARMPKLMPILYAPKWVYGDALKGLPYPLWESSYVSGSGAASALYPGDGSSRWGAYSGQTPAILQFTSSATIAGQTTCDANAFRGTLAELTALVAPGWEDDMPSVDELLGADKIPNDINPGVKGTPGYNESMTLEWALRYATHAHLALNEVQAMRKEVATMGKNLTTAIASIPVAVATAVVATLPEDRDDISQEEVTTAVQAAMDAAIAKLAAQA
jgi:hypothetical protein